MSNNASTTAAAATAAVIVGASVLYAYSVAAESNTKCDSDGAANWRGGWITREVKVHEATWREACIGTDAEYGGLGARRRPRVVRSECVWPSGSAFNWLLLRKLHYLDSRGQEREWEMAERVPRPPGTLMPPAPGPRTDGVFVVVVIHFSQEPNRPRELLLVHQFRPPVGCHVVEFTAGLGEAHHEMPRLRRNHSLKQTIPSSPPCGWVDPTAGSNP